MNIITTYLKKNLLLNFMVILLFFSVIACAMQFVSQMKFLGQGHYNLIGITSYVLLLLPRNIYKLSPIIVAVSIAYTAIKLENTKELVAIGAIGVSAKSILWSLFRLGVLIVLLFFVIGEVFGPWCANMAKNNRINAIASGKAFASNSGIWLHEGNWYINIAKIINSDNIENVTKYLVVEGDLKRTEHAKQGRYENHSWVLEDIAWTDISDNKISSGKANNLIWKSELNSSMVNNFNVMPTVQSLWSLRHSLSSNLDIGTNTSISKYIFWQRLFQPVALFLLLLFVGAVFFNISDYNKSDSGLKVAAFVLFYYFAPDYLLSLSFYNIPPILAAFIMPAATASVCYMLMRKNMLN